MLIHLYIKDFAIIDEIELDLGPGLTVLTGETGAGKSILVDALMLAIGGRGAADVIRHGAERAEIAATFDLQGNEAALAWLDEQAVSHEGEVQLRRVIATDGRSRLYANGQLLAAQAVRELAERLVEIHGQQEFLSLLKRDEQRALLDDYGGHGALLAPVARLSGDWRDASAALHELKSHALERTQRLELLRHQVEELDALRLAAGEVDSLSAEAARLAHRGRLKEAAAAALELLYAGEDVNAHALASRALSTLKGVATLDAQLAPVCALAEEALIGLKESGRALERYSDSLDVDPERQELVEGRMAAIQSLARKHRVAAGELPLEHARLKDELEQLAAAEVSASGLEEELHRLEREWRSAAAALSEARQKGARRLAKAVTERMRVLGMPGGRFEVALDADPAAAVSANGSESVEFLVTANPGQPPRPVSRVASGGELSRISLSIQVAVSERRHGRACRIFDEVDAGVGGAVAEMVGRELKALSRDSQVLCVTHLPQVASQADQHVRVSKSSDGRTSRTALKRLKDSERIEELARMLAGVSVTDTAREHARAMLSGSR